MTHPISFLTPYWNGRDLMALHLRSIRRFFPRAPILVSKRGGEPEEMASHGKEFGVRYWMEDCNYTDAFLRLLDRCETRFACVADHDTVLLSDPSPLLEGLADGRWDLVGIEERIRDHPAIDGTRLWPEYNGWMRLAPGYMDATFLMFDVRAFLDAHGMRGVRAGPGAPPDHEFHYGICEKLPRHKYLLPYHGDRYGIGNFILDGDTPVLWHQWFGAYRRRLEGEDADRLPGACELLAVVRSGEEAFLRDYPALVLSGLTPAWGPDRDALLDRRAVEAALPAREGLGHQLATRVRRWSGYGPRKFLAHGLRWLDRQWRLRS